MKFDPNKPVKLQEIKDAFQFILGGFAAQMDPPEREHLIDMMREIGITLERVREERAWSKREYKAIIAAVGLNLVDIVIDSYIGEVDEDGGLSKDADDLSNPMSFFNKPGINPSRN